MGCFFVHSLAYPVVASSLLFVSSIQPFCIVSRPQASNKWVDDEEHKINVQPAWCDGISPHDDMDEKEKTKNDKKGRWDRTEKEQARHIPLF